MVVKTAVIKIGGDIVRTPSMCQDLISSLHTLLHTGWKPIIVHGAGPQLNDALTQEPTYVEGLRFTTPLTLGVAQKVFLDTNTSLVNALLKSGISSRPVTQGVFTASLKDKAKFGLVGDVSDISLDSINASIDCNQIPVLSCMGQNDTGQVLNINADVAARALTLKLQPDRMVFISAKGGWKNKNDTSVKEIVMESDYDTLASQDYTGRQGTLLKLNEIKCILDALPSSSSVLLTSAKNLASDMMTQHTTTGTVCVSKSLRSSSSTQPIDFNNTSKKYRIGVLGARGYVGKELLRLIGSHPHFNLAVASSRSLLGQNVRDSVTSPPLNPHTQTPVLDCHSKAVSLEGIDPELTFVDLNPESLQSSENFVDAWILALPNEQSEPYVRAIGNSGSSLPVIVDLSADHRFNSKWAYGLPEIPKKRDALRSSTLISNPGCYATAAQLALHPLLRKSSSSIGTPTIFGVSGYSGAGTSVSQNNNMSVLDNNLVAYKPIGHIHEREISHHLGTNVALMPHVAPFFRGIHLTLSVPNNNSIRATVDSIEELYQDYYSHEKLVQVCRDIPHVSKAAHHHEVHIGGFATTENRLVFYATIDNLLKGAATQAIQNLNIALDVPELAGILK